MVEWRLTFEAYPEAHPVSSALVEAAGCRRLEEEFHEPSDVAGLHLDRVRPPVKWVGGDPGWRRGRRPGNRPGRPLGERAPLATELAHHFTVYKHDRRGRGDSGDKLPYVERELEDIGALIAEGADRRICTASR